MTPAMWGALIGWFLPVLPFVVRVPFGSWVLWTLIFDGYLLRLVFAVPFGVAAKVIWE